MISRQRNQIQLKYVVEVDLPKSGFTGVFILGARTLERSFRTWLTSEIGGTEDGIRG